MGQKYKIDRINLITYKGQKKKTVKSLRCRYIAKSHIVNCNAKTQSFEFVNFRGAQFKKVSFRNATFYGCDFWGTSFNECDLQNVTFNDCVFMACKFRNCTLTGSRFAYSTVVNTNLLGCKGIDVSTGVFQYKVYPACEMTPELEKSLELLKNDLNLKKCKVLFISDKKYNVLNLFLLQKRFRHRLPDLLLKLTNHSTANITTYKKLERTLNKLSKPVTI